MRLTTLPNNPILDLEPWVGQRTATFEFELSNGVTGERLGEIHPIRQAQLSHDTGRTIKRQLSLALGRSDAAAINPISDRVKPFMIVGGERWPLGKYMFTDETKTIFTSGDLASVVLNDEMFLVDQQILSAVNGNNKSIDQAIVEVLSGLPIDYTIEASNFDCVQAWAPGNGRGSILNALAVSGDYFSPWFGNDSKLHFIRTFNPANEIPQFDFDAGNKVLREGIQLTSDLLTAPNRFVVVSNTPVSNTVPVVAFADVPPTAPHSQVNRGFIIAETQDLQLSDGLQAQAVAQGFVNRQTIFQHTNLSTAADPRHDSYDVIFWQGDLWLEIAWELDMTEGGRMQHSMRKAFAAA